MTDWFARPVLHVSSVEASLRFYVDRLGFTVAWRYEEDGRARVAQVDGRLTFSAYSRVDTALCRGVGFMQGSRQRELSR